MNTTVAQSIEQLAITRSDVTLGIGDELQLDVARGVNADRALRGDQDFGIYVGGSAPVAGVRADFLSVYQRGGGQDALTSLFNAENLGGTTNDFNSNAAYDTLFITRTGADTYEGGILNGADRLILRDEVTIPTALGGPTVGFYADVRSADVLTSGYDNLTIVRAVPEPSSLALLALGSIGLIARRRKS